MLLTFLILVPLLAALGESLPAASPSSEVYCPPSTDGYAVFVPHPADCSLYYECAWDVPVLMACPRPLYFDPRLNVCNWPESVDCVAHAETTTTEEPIKTTVQVQRAIFLD
jgi:hypothetical protein